MIADHFGVTVSDSKVSLLLLSYLSLRGCTNNSFTQPTVQPAHLERLPPGSEEHTTLPNDELLSKQIEDGETIHLVVG